MYKNLYEAMLAQPPKPKKSLPIQPGEDMVESPNTERAIPQEEIPQGNLDPDKEKSKRIRSIIEKLRNLRPLREGESNA